MYSDGMRTTVDLDDDVAADRQLRRGASVGLSTRQSTDPCGLLQTPDPRFRQRSAPLG